MEKIAIAVNAEPLEQLKEDLPSPSQSTGTFHLGKRKFLFLLAIFCFAIFWNWRMDRSVLRSSDPMQPLCYPGDVAAKAAALISSYARGHPFFLQLSDYFWVKNETFSQLPYGTSGCEELLLQTLALTKSYSVPPEIERLPCRRCVVVGNGFRLKNSSLGEVINSYDIVIRLNNAPVHKHQQDVGNKTTMRFFYPESADFNQSLDNNPDSLMVLVPFKPLDIQWMKTVINNETWVLAGFWKKPPRHWEVNLENVRILNPYFMEFAATKILAPVRSWKTRIKEKPTTGMLAITFALHFCDQVHIAGFGYPTSSNNLNQLIHYYEHMTMRDIKVSGHNITLEAVAIKQLLHHGLIHNLTYF